ncbi:hypothetical protein MFIFM68171_04696 [Madurella fahalii]|uniref:Uncharacterized protein n=1 Tax=Madurella fahalii TaxID=1157608 RepID=A0ABQ0G9U1_9PEZI
MHSLHFSSYLVALAAFSANAALHNSDAADALLMGRQMPGTPLYECHENCGNTIRLGRDPNPCDNNDWVSAYEACLECALEFDIWRIYSTGVTRVAESCGLSPSPVPASSTPTSTSTSASGSGSAAPSETSAATTGTSNAVTEISSTATDAPVSSDVVTEPATTSSPDQTGGGVSEPTPTTVC